LQKELFGDDLDKKNLKFSSGKKKRLTVKTISPPKEQIRKISQSPFKVLDAPTLQDDYYLNLLDWSHENTICVGLDREVYTWSASTNKVQRVLEVQDDDVVTSVAWGQ